MPVSECPFKESCRPQAYNFIKNDTLAHTLAQVFSSAFYKIFKKTFFTEHI